MKRTCYGLTAAACVVALGVGLDARQSGGVRPPASPAPVVDRALVDKYCVTCHNQRLKSGGLTLDTVDFARLRTHAEVLEKVVSKLRSGQMPAPGAPRPDQPSLDAFATALEHALDREAAASPNPGRLPVRRLNRVEYIHAVRDLLDLEVDPALLPPDNPGSGFDNNSASLSLSPALMDRYMSAATKVSRLALGDPVIKQAVTEYKAVQFSEQDEYAGSDFSLGTHGGLAVRHNFPLDGEYLIKVRLQRNTAGGTIRGLESPVEVQLRLDRKLVTTFVLGGEHKGWDPAYELAVPEEDVVHRTRHEYRLTADQGMDYRLAVKAGARTVTAAFANRDPLAYERVPTMPQSLRLRRYIDDADDPGIDTVQIVGPFNAAVPDSTPSRRRIFTCRPGAALQAETCARRVITRLARLAFRQPVTEADLRELMDVFRDGLKAEGFEVGIGMAIETMLVSPRFLLRVERTPAGASPGSIHRVTDLDLASRLSFALWRSLPDEELLRAATAGELRTRAAREKQVRRMLADPKALRWIDDFMEQWLGLRTLQEHEPDTRFSYFTDSLRDAMLTETRLFVESQVRQDRSVVDLLRANYTFLNAELAKYYGVPGVYGGHFRRVEITNPVRQGLLGHGSILTATSYADRTSVVLRGKWVLATLLDAPPPPPPANVPALPQNQAGAPPRALRERMEQHRSNPVCATCHASMDPLGFALENFDATGRWRDTDDGAKIDAVSRTPQGATIDGPTGFRTHLVGRRDELNRTVTTRLLEYFIGRSLQSFDRPAVRAILKQAGPDARWSSIVLGVIESAPFQMTQVAGPEAPAAVRAMR